MANNTNYEVIIIGGGPAGLSAGTYTTRARLSSLLIEKELIGGQIVNAEMVENYPGFAEGISGFDLTQSMHQQATKFGMETLMARVTGLELEGRQKIVRTTEGDFTAKVVIIAGGSERQKLGVPGEVEFTGKGVSYCATCDGALFREQPVALVGGGNAAISEALHLAKFASKVTVIHRRRQLRATRILQESAFAEPKIDFRWDSTVDGIEGEGVVQRIRLNQVPSGEKSILEVAGIFIAIGFIPDTDYLKAMLSLDDAGHIITNENMETEVPGILAAGDIRHNSARQAITAAGDGATAAISVEKFLTEQK